MAMISVNGIQISYSVFGSDGPWVALITGGRRAHDEFIPLAQKLSAHGYRVLLHDRRNTGASDLVLDPTIGEEISWADDLCALLGLLGIAKAYVGGASSGSRTAMLTYLRHPGSVEGLLLMRITGGAFAAGRLPQNYYGQFIEAARSGGMDAVAAMPQFQERIAVNPKLRQQLLSERPEHFAEVLGVWKRIFEAGAHWPVMGITDDELAAFDIPTIVIPGNDKVHSSRSGIHAAEHIPNCALHQLPIVDEDIPLIPFEEWAPYEDEIVRVFDEFMRRTGEHRN